MGKKKMPDRDLVEIDAKEEFDVDLDAMLSIIDAEDVDDEDLIPTFDEDE